MTPLVGAHTAMPLGRIKIQEFAKDADKGDREFVMIVNETFREECGEARQMVWFVDSTIEKKPHGGVELDGAGGEREFLHPGRALRRRIPRTRTWGRPTIGKLTFITFFNAGVRVLDIRNPYQPKEVGYFIPPISKATVQRCGEIGGKQRCSNADDPEQQRRDRRPRLHLSRGPLEYRPAHSRADRRAARDRGVTAELTVDALGYGLRHPEVAA